MKENNIGKSKEEEQGIEKTESTKKSTKAWVTNSFRKTTPINGATRNQNQKHDDSKKIREKIEASSK